LKSKSNERKKAFFLSNPSPLLISRYTRAYILPGQDCLDPLLSVMLCRPEDLPPVLFVSTGKGDTLYNEGKVVVENAQSAKHADATFYPVDGVGHAWDKSATGEVAVKRDDLYKCVSNAVKRSWI
jgi:acetyl esterase/lipase